MEKGAATHRSLFVSRPLECGISMPLSLRRAALGRWKSGDTSPHSIPRLWSAASRCRFPFAAWPSGGRKSGDTSPHSIPRLWSAASRCRFPFATQRWRNLPAVFAISPLFGCKQNMSPFFRPASQSYQNVYRTLTDKRKPRLRNNVIKLESRGFPVDDNIR